MLADLDSDALALWMRKGIVTATMQLSTEVFCAVLECVAADEDTTNAQARVIRDLLATLH